jgi:hypothetical protein
LVPLPEPAPLVEEEKEGKDPEAPADDKEKNAED